MTQLTEPSEMQQSTSTLTVKGLGHKTSKILPKQMRRQASQYLKKKEPLDELYANQLTFLQQWESDLNKMVQRRQEILDKYTESIPEGERKPMIDALKSLTEEMEECRSDRHWIMKCDGRTSAKKVRGIRRKQLRRGSRRTGTNLPSG